MTNPLVGKTVTALQITEDKLAIRFILSDGSHIEAKCDADCCSCTWIEHISLPARGFPFTVTEAANVEMPDLGSNGDDYIQYYGFELKTDKGHMLIDYRNSSNGYYGGDLVWGDDYFYGGVYGQNVPDGDWVDVTKDF